MQASPRNWHKLIRSNSAFHQLDRTLLDCAWWPGLSLFILTFRRTTDETTRSKRSLPGSAWTSEQRASSDTWLLKGNECIVEPGCVHQLWAKSSFEIHVESRYHLGTARTRAELMRSFSRVKMRPYCYHGYYWDDQLGHAEEMISRNECRSYYYFLSASHLPSIVTTQT